MSCWLADGDSVTSVRSGCLYFNPSGAQRRSKEFGSILLSPSSVFAACAQVTLAGAVAFIVLRLRVSFMTKYHLFNHVESTDVCMHFEIAVVTARLKPICAVSSACTGVDSARVSAHPFPWNIMADVE